MTRASLATSEPRHGELRGHGFRTSVGASGLCALTTSLVDTYCAHCHRWVKTNGVLGPIRFMAEHSHAEESAS